jgi:hypothetical protein
MFFNYDSFEIVAIAFVVSGIFIYNYSFYNSSAAGPSSPAAGGGVQLKNESLVNTNSNLDSLSDLPVLDSHLNLQYVEASVQVQAVDTYVNTGMQTSTRMWYESIRNWIDELLSSPTQAGKYVDVGVQVDTSKSTWQTVKQWFLDVCSIRSSELSSIGENKVKKWRCKLDSTQSVDLHDSESPLTSLAFGSPNNSTLDKLVDPDDSASQLSPIISGSGAADANRVYDVTDSGVLNLYMQDETMDFEVIDNVHYAVTDNIYLSIDPSIVNLLL